MSEIYVQTYIFEPTFQDEAHQQFFALAVGGPRAAFLTTEDMLFCPNMSSVYLFYLFQAPKSILI